jgi:hypothetical protein
VFHLDEEINGKVYCVTTVAITAFVFCCWWTYMHLSRRRHHLYETAFFTANGPSKV